MGRPAWSIRGGSTADYVGAERFTRFWDVLDAAATPLERAAEALPDDPVPWDRLQWHGIGMQVGRARLDHLWEELTARDPRLYTAHHGRAQVLCPKWYGSDAELLGFARGTAQAAAPGDAVTAILALAHFEIAWDGIRESPGSGEDILQTRFRRQEVVRELAHAADKWQDGARPHPRAVEAMHLFGAAFYHGGQHTRAQQLLNDAGGRVPAILPWSAASLTPGRRYAAVRRDLGLD
ncbi:hypothetical protein [Nonomuraea sp. NPDC005501]|uniref:hypothetical protein n=1 Tax=Nonomuraea sp. NPDC005501 TaxID=3156884 RepID=UPI0033A7CEBE